MLLISIKYSSNFFYNIILFHLYLFVCNLTIHNIKRIDLEINNSTFITFKKKLDLKIFDD